MLIESKIKIGHDSMFNVPQANIKSAHLLNKMALVQFQCSRTVTRIFCLLLSNYVISFNDMLYTSQTDWQMWRNLIFMKEYMD